MIYFMKTVKKDSLNVQIIGVRIFRYICEMWMSYFARYTPLTSISTFYLIDYYFYALILLLEILNIN